MRIPRIGKECLTAIPYAAMVLPQLIEARIAEDMAVLYHDLGGRVLPEGVVECEKALTGFISRKAGHWTNGESLILDVHHQYGYLWHRPVVVVIVGQYSVFEVRHLAALKEAHPEKYEMASLLLKALYARGRLPIWDGGGMVDLFWDDYEIEGIVEEFDMDREYVTSLYKERDLIDGELSGLPPDVTLDTVLRRVKEMLKRPIPFTPAQRRWIKNSVTLLTLQQKEHEDHLIGDLEKECTLEWEDTIDPAEFFMVLWNTNGPVAQLYDDHLESISSSGINAPSLAYRPKDPRGLKAIARLCRMFQLLQKIFWEGGCEWNETEG
jgi:hypothetical protein